MECTYYTIQVKTVALSPWLKPEGRLKKEKEPPWFMPNWDTWELSFNPHIGTGNDWRAKYKAASDQVRGVWSKTGCKGWPLIRCARRAIKQARIDDANGMYNWKDGYGHLCQAVRHKYRIVRISVSRNVEIIGE